MDGQFIWFFSISWLPQETDTTEILYFNQQNSWVDASDKQDSLAGEFGIKSIQIRLAL